MSWKQGEHQQQLPGLLAQELTLQLRCVIPFT